MTEIKPSSIISQSSDQVSKKLDDATIIMSIEEGKYFNLNNVASRIWEIIEERCTLEKLIQQLESEFEISKGDCSRDVNELLMSLLDISLIEVK